MEKQEKNQLKDLLNKYLDSTPMGANHLMIMSASDLINMIDNSSTNGEQTEEAVLPSVDDHLTAVDLYEKLLGDDSDKKLTSQELSKELEEANEFLKYATNMCANAFGIDGTELEDSSNENSYDEPVSVFDLDIKEADDIYDNLYDWGLEDADVYVDKEGNVLVYELLSE